MMRWMLRHRPRLESWGPPKTHAASLMPPTMVPGGGSLCREQLLRADSCSCKWGSRSALGPSTVRRHAVCSLERVSRQVHHEVPPTSTAITRNREKYASVAQRPPSPGTGSRQPHGLRQTAEGWGSRP